MQAVHLGHCDLQSPGTDKSTAPIFNQALANSALQFETIGAVQVLERPAMCYHSLAITAIRQELDEQELNVTEELIASVACVISWNVRHLCTSESSALI